MGQAVGIPNTTDYGNLQGLKPGNIYTISVQRHKAERAGEHLDFRIGDPKTQLLSWAIPKAKLPEPNERLLAVQQPLHEYEYATFEGTIDEGYGKGEVKLEKLGKALVTDIEPGKIHITIISDRYPTRYVLIQPQNYKQNDWLILNTTPNKPIDYEKIHMRQLKPDELNDYLDKNKEQPLYASPKIDGAHVIVLIKDGKLEVFSYRISKVHGGNILHTERLFRIRPKVQIPERLNGTILKGELYAVDKDTGEAIPVNVLSGLLNSSIYRTYQDAANKGVQFRIGLFDIYKYGDQIIDPEAVDYPSRLNLIREFLPQLDKKIFHIIEPVRKPEEVSALWDVITQGRHPLTKEGIVLYPHKGNPVKVKAFQERDVYIQEILPGEGKYKGKAAGGFTYSLEPNGPIVGHVGTGFSDELRREMWEDPDEFINRRARVKFQEQLPSGALRAPVLIALHEDYPNQKEAGLDPEDPYWLKTIEWLQQLRLHYKLEKLAGRTETYDDLKQRHIDRIPWLEKEIENSPVDIITKIESLIGGPTPLTNLLVLSSLGVLSGGGLGLLMEKLFPSTFSGVTWRLALLGTLLGAAPALITNVIPAIESEGFKGLFKSTPAQKLIYEDQIKKAASFLHAVANDVYDIQIDITETDQEMIKQAFDRLNTRIDVDRWGEFVMQDPHLNSWEKTMSVSIPLVTSVVKQKDPYVTIGDVAETALNMGLGSLFGSLLGGIAGAILGLTPEAQQKIQQSGEFAGLMKSLLLPVRQTALELRS